MFYLLFDVMPPKIGQQDENRTEQKLCKTGARNLLILSSEKYLYKPEIVLPVRQIHLARHAN